MTVFTRRSDANEAAVDYEALRLLRQLRTQADMAQLVAAYPCPNGCTCRGEDKQEDI